jgi:hypothetical protein
MRPGLRSHRTYTKRYRPIRKRSAVVLALALAAALGVGLIAFPASAAAAPPVVQTCTPKPSTSSDSCVRLTVNALAPPIGQVPENVRLGVRMRAVFDPPTDEWVKVDLRFDDDIFLSLGTIPVCSPSELTSKTIAQAYEQCGPGADGNPPSEGNAYLSPPGNVSGKVSTKPPEDKTLCTMVFRGPNWDPPPTGGPLFPTLTLYFRGFVDPTTGCDNPAINAAGTFTVVLPGPLTREAASSSYDWNLRFPNLHVLNFQPDDFYATLQRGSVFRARCPAGTSPHKLVGIFDYTFSINDTIAPPYPGTTDACP